MSHPHRAIPRTRVQTSIRFTSSQHIFVARLVTKHCGKAQDAAFGVDTHSNTIRRNVTHEQHNFTLRICVIWTTASRTKRCHFRSVTTSTLTTKHPLRRGILENGSGAALHHHSLTNEKFKSFAALRQRQEMNLTLDCNLMQRRIRSLLHTCRAPAHAHLQLITKHDSACHMGKRTQRRQHHDNTFANDKLEPSSCACVFGPKTFSGKHVSSVRTLCAVRKHVWKNRNRLLQLY